MSSEFTIEELINAIAAARVDTEPARGVRVQELKQATGHSEATLTRRLRALIDAGLLEYVPVPLTRIDGRVTTVAGYRLINDKKL